MRSRTTPLLALLLGLILSVQGCLPRHDRFQEVQFAVAGTLTALPSPTSSLTLPPSPFPNDLAVLFCEYHFCIGHPSDMAFFDVSAQQNPASPSSYNQGILATYSPTLFIELIWQQTPSNSDPQPMINLILEEDVDTRKGSIELILISEFPVFHVLLDTTATPLLPHGSAAAWTCGNRAFAWKAYTPGQTQSEALLKEALAMFRCE